MYLAEIKPFSLYKTHRILTLDLLARLQIGYKLHSMKFIFALLFLLTSLTASALPVLYPGLSPVVSASNNFPEITDPADKEKMIAAIRLKLKPTIRRMGLSDADLTDVVEHVRHYLAFQGLTSVDFEKALKTPEQTPRTESAIDPSDVVKAAEDAETADEEIDKTPSNLKAITRLFKASTQFLYCDDMSDWVCLEKAPKMKLSGFRRESKSELGKPLFAGESFDGAMEVFFTQAWDWRINDKGIVLKEGTPPSRVVDELANRLSSPDIQALSMAIYGIDDINGKMKGVYDAIATQASNPQKTVRAVVDIAGIEKLNVFRDNQTVPVPHWILSYVKPDASAEERWLFSPSHNPANPNGMHATFQYDGTPSLFHLLNDFIPSDEEARLRVEWNPSHIMHNKFVVLENQDGSKAVWTGTANISNHCMGSERNANMSVFIKNTAIANAFLDEFNHMFEPIDPDIRLENDSSRVVAPSEDPSEGLPVGRFHHNKFPVSHRYFTFNDGTQFRVHFAPTDDAEHRVILPMLYSAGPGDLIRVSMFGGTGYEIVRAFQFAVARGANVQIVFDSMLSHGTTSWTQDPRLNVNSENPYLGKVGLPDWIQPGKISIKVSNWDGKNHYKVGSLTRGVVDYTLKTITPAVHAESIVIGSQNWSSGGNDENDENLISIQNKSKDVDAAVKFNQEFDTHLWPLGRIEGPRPAWINGDSGGGGKVKKKK